MKTRFFTVQGKNTFNMHKWEKGLLQYKQHKLEQSRRTSCAKAIMKWNLGL